MIPSGAYKPLQLPGRQVNSQAGATTTQGPQLDTAPQMPQLPPMPSGGMTHGQQFRANLAAQRAGGPQAPAQIPTLSPGQVASPNAPGSSQYTGGGGGYQGAINGIDPVKVNLTPDIFNGFDKYREAAYDQSTRMLDPQFKQARADFEQQMVGRGFSPGTEAYDNALANFDRGKNDAYAQARSQALAQGLAANQQAFGQGLSQSQLANDLQKAKWSLEASQAGERASEYSAALNRDMNMAQLGWDKDKFGQTFGAGQDQQDFENLMRLFGAGQQTQQYNNSLLGADQSRLGSLMNLIPGQQNSPNIDVQTPYNNQWQAQTNQAQANQQAQDSRNQAYTSAAMMLASYFCDENAKDTLGAADEEACLRALNAVRFDTWKYKGDSETHLGTYAQDFNRELGLEPKTVIREIDFMGALLGSVRALMARNEKLQARVEALENG